MAMRKNFGVKMGAPKGPKMGGRGAGPMAAPGGLGGMPGGGAPSPMQGFSGAMPGAAFRKGGSVNSFRQMPSHHEDSRLSRGHSEHGHGDIHDHHKADLGGKGDHHEMTAEKFCRGGRS